MKEIELDYISCDLCGSEKSSLFSIMQADYGWKWFPKDFTYVRCENCELLYLNPRPKPENLFEYYDEETIQTKNFVKGHVSAYFHNYVKGKKYHVKNAQLELKKIENFKNPGRLLEIGCAAGFFLNEAKKNGWEVYGVEPSKNFVLYANEKLELNVELGTLEKANFPENFFDTVVHFDLISHLFSPSETFKSINRVLKPGGLHYFRTGNKGELKNKSQGEKGEVWGVPEHLYHFSRKNLNILLKKNGFETDKIIATANLNNIIFKNDKNNDSDLKSTENLVSCNKRLGAKNSIKNLIKNILHSSFVFPLYRKFRENRHLWEKLGRIAIIVIRPISATVWVISTKK